MWYTVYMELINKKYYLAGFFDGEGCVGIYPTQTKGGNSYRVEVQVSGTEREPLDEFVNLYGGKVYFTKIDNPKWKDIYQWVSVGKSATKFLGDMVYLCLNKKPQIKVAIEFLELPYISNLPNIKSVKEEIKERVRKENLLVISKKKKLYEKIKQLKKQQILVHQ